MGLFSVGKVNTLLLQTEAQLARISDKYQFGASKSELRTEVNKLRQLHAQLNYHFIDSSIARTAMYSFLGRKCRSWEVAGFLTEIIRDMENDLNGVV